MVNISKYWIIMESLQFPVIGVGQEGNVGEEQRLKNNLKIMQDFFKLSAEGAVKQIIKNESIQRLHEIAENSDDHFLYCLYSLKMVLEILEYANFSSSAKEDLVSERHKSLMISSIIDIGTFALQENLHSAFYIEKRSIFQRKHESETNFFRLEFLVKTFSKLICVRELRVGKSLDDVQLYYMGCIFSVLIAVDANNYHLEEAYIGNLKSILQSLWVEHSKKLYYRNLMLLFSSLPNVQRPIIHREMLLRLWSPGGFVALVLAMSESKRNEEQSLDEIIANVVAQPNFSIKAQHSLIKQILKFLESCLKNKDFAEIMDVGILSLRKLYDNKEENREYLKMWLTKKMEPLIKVEESKLNAMEWLDFADLISLLFHTFCTSSIATLPSVLLVPYLPLILDVYIQLECHTNQNTLDNHLQSLILQILNNRTKEELKRIIECVTLKSYPKEWYQLSFNIHLKENPLNMQELKLSIVDSEVVPLLSGNKYPLAVLVSVLKNSFHNLLVYEHFLILLQLLPSLIVEKNSNTTNNDNIDLLASEEDICNKILMDFSIVYGNKIQIIKALESLLQHQPLKSLMNDNIKDLLKVLQDILTAYAKTLGTTNSIENETSSSVLIIIITLIREIVDSCSTEMEDLETNLIKPLKILESQTQNENLKYHINWLLKMMKRGKSHYDTSSNEFENARSLIESSESYLQVQGIEMTIKLLNKRDVFTVSNSHMLIALALNTLKSSESYTFLNCVRLFVALVNVNESEVLDLLSNEYLNEAAAMDYRLVIGEATLKTSKELGPLCYKYKNTLLNTYMAGCRSTLDEFRFSAFSNLSQMCRLLTYQVHSYFQELLNLIDCELTNGKYLPAKRAAIMVLSDLLAGMDNLFDYEEMLLPIYRLLKYLVNLEANDEKIRIHAANGLKCLSIKCKELLSASLEHHTSLEKEIKILGIRDNPKRNSKSHILEIN